ncbi:YbaK/EbsC family protein [Streptomyces sp. H10-C2]|uniref:YbaK/EbsC family protein n=1 Tax=unclassified Streptomyces TaxID=2593676 RepID=UPI0024BB885B|nr:MULTISPECIES: YbaK/EbsC family protein [unclassified Streptomyces]MDJ0347517.1 YbaK/EbsC family protein [Streptomyces sp. PH10-H1]MDJ0368566.1 YbaK/EbsC family protein [Streptomyces sp. H10-C2]
MRAPIGTFDEAHPATDRLDLLPAPVAAAVTAEMLYVDTDPAKADTAAFAETYGADLLEASANCVVVAGKRGQDVTLAACLVLSTTRVDVNGAVRRHLGARKASFAAMDTATGATGMEYGGITPVGLPADWPLLIDAAVVDAPYLVIGSGARRGKLIVPGKVLARLPGAVVLEGLGI